MEVYQHLYERYGQLDWWPANSLYEMMLGAVLTQNTAWSNVEKALERLGTHISPEEIEAMSEEELAEKIRPAGFFNQKALYIRALTQWYKGYGYRREAVEAKDLRFLRRELLEIKGIGRETADCILLYGFNKPTFVIDAYTKRLLARLRLVPSEKQDYEPLRLRFQEALPRDVFLYNNYHALIVINAKTCCRKKSPLCPQCPLESICGGEL